jgi:hypothetical protein
MDVCGPLPVPSPGGSRYFATFLDDYSKFSVVVPLHAKADVPDTVKRIVKQLETQTGHHLRAVRTDRGGEYLNHRLNEYLSSKGVLHQTTAPYTPEQNGSAERLNRTLMERVRAMLLGAGLSQELWAEAVVTANYIRNRSPVNKGSKTPWEYLMGHKPDVSGMKVFGAKAYVMTPKQLRAKLDPVSQPGIFVGYSITSKAYRVLLDGNSKVVESRDVMFDESHLRGHGVAAVPADNDPDEDQEQEPASPASEDMQDAAPQDAAELERSNTEEGELRAQPRARGQEDQSATDLRYPQRERRAPGNWFEATHHAHSAMETDEPTTVEEALSKPDAEQWKRAMDEEIASLAENETW